MQSSVLRSGQDLHHLSAVLVLPAAGVVKAGLHQYWLPEGAKLFQVAVWACKWCNRNELAPACLLAAC